jgi:aspartyl/asparaginyl beta-hydroxylase (cupin superfamily)
MIRGIVEKALFTRDKTFFNPEEFPWTASIEAEWKTIRKELDAVMLRR